ncbi:DnaJ-like protein [Geothermobacter ehrlichii]|uniref:DnaJ-like protein n=1 Tax=Geothermobacter ehrlichii TaxID=213224 RepID=A0A5D3WJK3_9BACT|nr:J domain-containing protein [Geothermobacter ehrlichii]TYO99106.1 DnaJ-like protein [Geothermobacter ehrlichii]
MEPTSYEDLRRALQTFGLDANERISLATIRDRYRSLVKKLHPDRHGGDPEEIRRVNEAYRTLRAYCDSYRFCFSEEEFYRQNPEAHLLRQFATDPAWGGLQAKDED